MRISYNKDELKGMGCSEHGCIMANGVDAFIKVGSAYYRFEEKKPIEYQDFSEDSLESSVSTN